MLSSKQSQTIKIYDMNTDDSSEYVPWSRLFVFVIQAFKDLQVPEILVVVQIFVVDGGEGVLVGDVTVRRYKCVCQKAHLLTERCINRSILTRQRNIISPYN